LNSSPKTVGYYYSSCLPEPTAAKTGKSTMGKIQNGRPPELIRSTNLLGSETKENIFEGFTWEYTGLEKNDIGLDDRTGSVFMLSQPGYRFSFIEIFILNFPISVFIGRMSAFSVAIEIDLFSPIITWGGTMSHI